MSDIQLNQLISALSTPGADLATKITAIASPGGATPASLSITSTVVAITDNPANKTTTLAIHIPQQGLLQLPLPEGAAQKLEIQPNQQLQLTFQLEGQQLKVTLQPKQVQVPLPAIELPVTDEITNLVHRKIKIDPATLDQPFSIPLGQARRLPGERIKLLTSHQAEHIVLQPQAGKLQFNQSYNVGYIHNQQQPKISFSTIAVPPKPVSASMPLSQYHQQNPDIRLDKLITDTSHTVSRMSGGDTVSETAQLSIVITSQPTSKSSAITPLAPFWLKFQPLPALMKDLSAARVDLENDIAQQRHQPTELRAQTQPLTTQQSIVGGQGSQAESSGSLLQKDAGLKTDPLLKTEPALKPDQLAKTEQLAKSEAAQKTDPAAKLTVVTPDRQATSNTDPVPRNADPATSKQATLLPQDPASSQRLPLTEPLSKGEIATKADSLSKADSHLNTDRPVKTDSLSRGEIPTAQSKQQTPEAVRTEPARPQPASQQPAHQQPGHQQPGLQQPGLQQAVPAQRAPEQKTSESDAPKELVGQTDKKQPSPSQRPITEGRVQELPAESQKALSKTLGQALEKQPPPTSADIKMPGDKANPLQMSDQTTAKTAVQATGQKGNIQTAQLQAQVHLQTQSPTGQSISGQKITAPAAAKQPPGNQATTSQQPAAFNTASEKPITGTAKPITGTVPTSSQSQASTQIPVSAFNPKAVSNLTPANQQLSSAPSPATSADTSADTSPNSSLDTSPDRAQTKPIKTSLSQARLNSLLQSLNVSSVLKNIANTEAQAEMAADSDADAHIQKLNLQGIAESQQQAASQRPSQMVVSLLKQLQRNLPDMAALTTATRLEPVLQQLLNFDPLSPNSINLSTLGPLAAALQMLLGAKKMASAEPSMSPELLQHLNKIVQQSKTSSKSAKSSQPGQGLQLLGMLASAEKLSDTLSNIASNIRLYQYSSQEQSTSNQQVYYFALPTSDPSMPQIEGQLERQQQEQHNGESRSWQLTIMLPLGGGGKMLATAELMGKNVTIKMTADNPTIQAEAQHYLDFLRERLTSLGLQPGEISCRQGSLPPTLLKRPHNLVETIV